MLARKPIYFGPRHSRPAHAKPTSPTRRPEEEKQKANLPFSFDPPFLFCAPRVPRPTICSRFARLPPRSHSLSPSQNLAAGNPRPVPHPLTTPSYETLAPAPSVPHPPRAAAMDEDRSADPARRARLLSPPSGQPQAPRAPALPMDLSSQYQRRFGPSLFLPPMAPRLAPGSGAFSAFSNYQGPPAAFAPLAAGGSHLARSLPKAPFFSTDSLAPLPYSVDPVAGAGAAVPRSPPSLGSEQQGPSASGLPPRGAHRRSRSDFIVGFSLQNQLPLPVLPAAEGFSRSADAAALVELFRSYRDPKSLSGLGFSGDVPSEGNSHLGNQMSSQRAWSPADSSDNEAESWATGGGGGASISHPRHCRSLSVDSIMGNLNFGALGQVSPTLLPPSTASGAGGGVPRTGSGPSGSAAAVATSELANGEFTESEMKKIMANERLAELALADPKRVKRFEF